MLTHSTASGWLGAHLKAGLGRSALQSLGGRSGGPALGARVRVGSASHVVSNHFLCRTQMRASFFALAASADLRLQQLIAQVGEGEGREPGQEAHNWATRSTANPCTIGI